MGDYTLTIDNGMGDTKYVPDGCGYRHRYRYIVKLNTYGVGGTRVQWMKENCIGKFGWHFDPKPDADDQYEFYEGQTAVVTFTHKIDATMFMLVYGDD